MTSKQYQNLVTAFLEEKGYSVSIPSRQRDYGVDLIAKKEGKAMGVQVRLYSEGHRATYQNIMNLFAGSRYLGCTTGLFVTNSAADEEAHAMADKFRIAIMEGWVPKNMQ